MNKIITNSGDAEIFLVSKLTEDGSFASPSRQDPLVAKSTNEGNEPEAIPVTTQPVGGQNLNIIPTISNSPPGLEYLCLVDELTVIKQPYKTHWELGKKDSNRYNITNVREEKMYYAAEYSTSFQRNWCLSSREFEMKVFDNFHKEIISMHRPLRCGQCCCPCRCETIEVSSPPGTIIGVVEEKCGFPLGPRLVIKNDCGDIVLRIKGTNCGKATNFALLSSDGKTNVGKIYHKTIKCCGPRIYNDEHVFGLKFPVDLDVKMKATILGACFLIEMMYFYRDGNDRNSITNNCQ